MRERIKLTQIHGCLRASEAVIRLAGFTDNIWLIRFLASGVTVSHSGDGYYTHTGSEISYGNCAGLYGKTHVVGTSFDLSVQPMLVLVPERRVAHQQDVQNHTCDKITKPCVNKMLTMLQKDKITIIKLIQPLNIYF